MASERGFSLRSLRANRRAAFFMIAMLPAALLAQSNEIGGGETGAYTGIVAGMGFHPAVGGNIGMTFSRYSIALIDIAYIPLGGNTLLSRPTTALFRNSGLYDFGLNIHIPIPIHKRWTPYGILGFGLLYNVYQTAIITPEAAVFADQSKTNFVFNTGGGVRYYIGKDWGIRPEVKASITSRNFTTISVGVFYNFSEDWPFRSRAGGNQ